MESTQYETTLVRTLSQGLDGVNAHLPTFNTFDGITLQSAVAKVSNAPYTIWQLICHIDFWQQWFTELASTGTVKPVAHDADGWIAADAAPANEEELRTLIQSILHSTENARTMMQEPAKYKMDDPKGKYGSGYDVIQAMGNHLSYHAGQIMMLRRMLGNYPPPSGGDTW